MYKMNLKCLILKTKKKLKHHAMYALSEQQSHIIEFATLTQ